MFISAESLKKGSWQSFERAVARLLIHEGFEGVRLVGQTRDRGADLLAHRGGKRWLFQVKHWKSRVSLDVVDRTLDAMRTYRANVPVIVSLNGFNDEVHEHQRSLLSRGIPLQLWDAHTLINRAVKIDSRKIQQKNKPREYQEEAIRATLRTYNENLSRSALIVLATGLGKTFVACESVRRLNGMSPMRVLIIVHTNELVYQFERAFWPFLTTQKETLVWNGYERPDLVDLERAQIVVTCLNTISDFIHRGGTLPYFDLVLIDECHHVGGQMYNQVLEDTRAGKENGPFLLGLTATPWRADNVNLSDFFGEPLICVDITAGLKKGFLSNVDYRMYTDNINWDALQKLKGSKFSPKQINRTLFISEWDDAVVFELKKVWNEQTKPRAIVFCGTIDHAITMRDRINALGFCNAAAIYSQTSTGKTMECYERNKILCDFHDGIIDVICAVDILNEGVDVPDVNIIVFQRVTHSRRIFIQQLGRGLRLAPDKEKVIVLDFVSDIRRFAAGLELKDTLNHNNDLMPNKSIHVKLQHKVGFKRVGGDDPQTESFLREWLEDVSTVENAEEDASILKFPPVLPGGRK